MDNIISFGDAVKAKEGASDLPPSEDYTITFDDGTTTMAHGLIALMGPYVVIGEGENKPIAFVSLGDKIKSVVKA